MPAAGRPSPGRRLTGAILLDTAMAPAFMWDLFAVAASDDLGVDPRWRGVGLALGLASFTLGVLVCGQVLHRHRPVVVAGLATVLGVSGLGLAAAAPGFGIMVVSVGVVFGAAAGGCYAVALAMASRAARRGLALTLVVSAYALAVVVAAGPVGAIVESRGWRAALVAVAIGYAACAAAGTVLLRGEPVTEESRTSTLGRPPTGTGWRRLWLLMAVGSAPGLAAFAVVADVRALPPAAAIAALSLGNALGRLAAGPAVDRFGWPACVRVAAVVLAASCAALVAAAESQPVVSAVALTALGVEFGAIAVLAPAATADEVGASDFPVVYGWVFTGWGFAGLIAPVTAAWSARTVGLEAPFAASLVLAAICYWLARS